LKDKYGLRWWQWATIGAVSIAATLYLGYKKFGKNPKEGKLNTTDIDPKVESPR